jgi:hypothetical protein
MKGSTRINKQAYSFTKLHMSLLALLLPSSSFTDFSFFIFSLSSGVLAEIQTCPGDSANETPFFCLEADYPGSWRLPVAAGTFSVATLSVLSSGSSI